MSDKSTRRSMIKLPRLSALLTYPHSNTRDPGHYASLRITDEDSLQQIVEIELDPEQLFALMANMSAYGVGQANANAHRFGRTYEHQTVRLDRKEWGLDCDSDENHPAIRANMKALRDQGWEVVTYGSKHGQHYLECARWTDAAPARKEE